MKAPLQFLILCLLFPFGANAQTTPFVTSLSNSFGGSLNEEFFGGTICLDGGYFMTGLTYSNDGNINMPIPYDTANIFVVKCDAQGVFEWSGTYGGNDYDKARYGMQDADSNFVVVGTTHSNDGDITFTHGNSELFVIKLDPSGNLKWMKQYGGTGWESGRYCAQTADGNYLIAGYSSSKNHDLPPGGHGLHEGWLMKIDTSGTIIWSNNYGGSGVDRIRHFIELPNGDFVFTGSSTSDDFDCPNNQGGMDFWAGRVDASGNLIWSSLYGGSGEDWAYHINPTMSGDFLITGYSDSGNGTLNGNYGIEDGWIIKIDAAGNLIDQNNIGGSQTDRLYKSYELPSGEIVTAGYSQSTDHDLTGINPGPSKNIWYVSLNPQLQQNWGYTSGGSGVDLGKELLLNPNDSSVVIMGDSNSNNGAVIGNHGDFDFWLVKLAIFTDTAEIPDSDDWNLNYDPSAESINLSSLSNAKADIYISNALGQLVYKSMSRKLTPGKNRLKISGFNEMTSGLYSITVEINGDARFLKIGHIKK